MPQFKFTNSDQLSAALNAFPEDMRVKVLEQGVKKALVPMLAAAKGFAVASEDTGALQTSLTTKTVNYPEAGKVLGLMGPARGKFVGRKKSKNKLGTFFAAVSGTLSQPSRYAHLVENGHVAKNGKFVPPKPFIRPAVTTTMAEQEAGFNEGIATGFEATRKKYAT